MPNSDRETRVVTHYDIVRDGDNIYLDMDFHLPLGTKVIPRRFQLGEEQAREIKEGLERAEINS